MQLSKSLLNGSQTTPYRIGNSTLRFQTKYVLLLGIIIILGLMYIILPTWGSHNDVNSIHRAPSSVSGKRGSLSWSLKPELNYPRTPPIQTEKGLKYRFGIIADLDTASKTPAGKWISYLRKGNFYIQFNPTDPKASVVSIEWESGEPQVIKSGLNQDGRGMELSELIAFDNRILTCDDRTGIVYSLNLDGDESLDTEPVPWVILADGNGTAPKGFKCEWACVKEGQLWIGGLGKEWTTPEGELINHNPQFIKRISATGMVTHWDWRRNYAEMAHALAIHFPGYVIHESGGWSDILQKWMFLPRRASKEQYNEKTDEKMGTNVILLADEAFKNIEVRHVGEVIPSHGFSSFKWIPGTNDQLVMALKSEEMDGTTATYLMIFTTEGHVLLPETKVGDHKYEGIEFL